jgi:nitroreductase / dihydropteridine reductase
MNLADTVQTRHTVKAFEPGRVLPAAAVDQLLAVLQNSPSSVNSQPWHYVVASSPEGRARIAAAAQGQYEYNSLDLDNTHLEAILHQEDRDGRFHNADSKARQDQSRRTYVDLHRYELRDVPQWLERQVYLALGGLLLGAAVLGIDATPMEGFDSRVLDRELGLRQRGLTSVVLAAFGYRSNQDFNAALPKSRLSREQIFTFI